MQTDDDLELTVMQTRIESELTSVHQTPRQPARNAIRHIKMAWKLRHIDKEMAMFRAITGEEEAVTAIIQSITRLRYDGTRGLNRRNHVHKWTIDPYVDAVSRVIMRVTPEHQRPTLGFALMQDGVERLSLWFSLEQSGERYRLHVFPPLHFEMKDKYGQAMTFTPEMFSIGDANKRKQIRKKIEELANKRNHFLYASDVGIPMIQTADLSNAIITRRNTIFFYIGLLLMIDPYPERQNFVQHCINEMIDILRLNRPEPDYQI